MKCWMLGTLGLLVNLTAPAVQAEPTVPANCLDSSRIGSIEGITPTTIALRLDDGQRFKVELSQACPSPENGLSVHSAAPDRLCGVEGDAMVIDGTRCDVASVASIDARSYADLLRQRDEQRIATAPPAAQTRGSRRSEFRGSNDYCVDVKQVRRWNEDPQGVTVEMSPRARMDNRFYRIELASGCPTMLNANTMKLVSGQDIGMVCGHPGDRMQLMRPEQAVIRPGDRSTYSSQHECLISRVYPITEKN